MALRKALEYCKEPLQKAILEILPLYSQRERCTYGSALREETISPKHASTDGSSGILHGMYLCAALKYLSVV